MTFAKAKPMLRTTGQLAAWSWAMVRRPYAVLCLLFAVVQTSVMALLSRYIAFWGQNVSALYFNSGQWLLLIAAWLAAGILSLRMLHQANGKTKAGYTLLTLPGSRLPLYGSQVLLCLVMQLGIVALQVMLYALYYTPLSAALAGEMNRMIAGNNPPIAHDYPTVTNWQAAKMYEDILANDVFTLIFPTRPRAMFCVALAHLTAALCLPCVALHRSGKQCFAQGIVTALIFAAVLRLLLVERIQYSTGTWQQGSGVVLLVTVALVVGSVAWALYALQNADIVKGG